MEDLLFLPPELYKEEARLRQAEYCKEQALHARGLLNDLNQVSTPNKLIYSDDMVYAFVYDRNDNGNDEAIGYALWCCGFDDHIGEYHAWTEVSDLTSVAVFTYEMLKEIAVDIGWIDRDSRWLI